jgi:hypothetical protein
MESGSLPRLDHLERAMSMKWALLLLSTIAFIDCYLLLFHQINVSGVSLSWLNNNVDLSDGLILIVMFSTSFGLLIPGISFTLKSIFGVLIDRLVYRFSGPNNLSDSLIKRNRDLINNIDYISVEAYRCWAIKNSNSAAYKDYEKFISEREEADFIRYICRCCILLFGASFCITCLDSLNHLSFIEQAYIFLQSMDWYFEYPSKLIIVGLGIFIFGIGFQEEAEYRDVIRIDNLGINKDASQTTVASMMKNLA